MKSLKSSIIIIFLRLQEAILCKLQTHVEEEQIRWGRELKIKEDSISRLSEELEVSRIIYINKKAYF